MTFLSKAFKIFADVSSLADIVMFSENPQVGGFTTNPTLISRGGVTDYKSFALEALSIARPKSLSLEVVADDLEGIISQARTLASWGDNVYVKIPISTTSGESCAPVIRELLDERIPVNATAIMTDEQVGTLVSMLTPSDDVILSVFAGRIADTGVDPVPVMRRYVAQSSHLDGTKVLWASPREALNIVQAEEVGCQIITVTPDLLKKTGSFGKDLGEFSLETVKMFFDDAAAAGLEVA